MELILTESYVSIQVKLKKIVLAST